MKIHKAVPIFLMLLAANQTEAQTPYDISQYFTSKILNCVSSPSQVKKQTKQIKHVKKDGKKTILLPVEWKGNINLISDAWSTGTTLTGSKSYINGPFYGNLKAVNAKGDTIDAYLEYADKNIVIKQFENTNPKLKTGLLKKELSNYKVLPKEYACIFKDGKLLEKDELDLLNRLKDGKYIFTYFYRAKDKKASLPGIFIIDKQGKNFDYECSVREKREKQEIKTGKKLTPEEREKKSEYLRKKLYNEKISDVEKSEEDKEKHSKRDSCRSPLDSSRIKVKTKEDYKIKSNYEIGIGYDGDEFYSVELRFGDKFRIGPAFGYASQKERKIKTPVINNFYGDGSELSERYFLGISAGLDLSENISSNVAIGIEIDNKKVDEKIRRSNKEIVSQNIDNYSDKNLRGYLGLDYKFKKFSIGPRFVYSNKDKKGHAGLMARLRF